MLRWVQMDMKKSSPAKSNKKKERSFLGRLLQCLFVLFFIGSVAAAGGLAWYINKISADLPSDEVILSYQANEASILYDRKHRVITELFIENRKPMKLEDISKWMVMSILAAEDSEFYSHKGIRPMAILRSLLIGEGGQGASTITQQLARNLFLTQVKSMERKAKEALITLRLEKLFSKDKLIETYLNAIYFGHGAWGIDSAAHSYFDKSAANLTLAEASILAGLVAAPEKYSPLRHLDLAKNRQNYVLKRLVALGWATEEEVQAAEAEELKFNALTEENQLNINKAPYFVSHILFKELIPEYGSDRIYKGGMKIYTTLDLDLQQAAEEAMKGLESQGGFIAIDPNSGAVLALVGGKDYGETKFNRVTQAYRQCGSSFKPIVYTTAIEAGYRPIDHILDNPITLEVPNSPVPVWSPRNFGDTYSGEETLLSALAHSHNTPTVRLTCMLGPESIVNVARRLGISSPYLSPILSIGLGTASVTPLEMSVIYSTFANGGAKVTPYFITEVRSKEDKILFSALPSQTESIRPATALIVRSMLQEVVRSGTGYRARIPGYEVFGKTGTTNDYTDAWFIGGVPGLVAVVYAGNDDLKPLGGKNATGSQIALPIWSAFMNKAVEILDVPHTFPPIEADVVPMHVCVESGYTASPECKKVTNIFMPEDQIPFSICPMHGGGSGNDPNAPRLLLLPFDGEVLGRDDNLVVQYDQMENEEEDDTAQVRDASSLRRRTPPQEEPAENRSWRDYIKKEEGTVDERFNRLLKKYNIQ